jgi:hypothetical protein
MPRDQESRMSLSMLLAVGVLPRCFVLLNVSNMARERW